MYFLYVLVVCNCCMYYLYILVEVTIFGIVHPSTFEFKNAVGFRFFVKRFDPGDLPQ